MILLHIKLYYKLIWIPAMLQEHVAIASSSSSESKDKNDEFFNQESSEDNRAFMKLI